MKENITRRDWLNKSAAVLDGSILGSMAGINPLKATPTINTNEPVQMMYNENPFGPSQVARRAMRKAFAEDDLSDVISALNNLIEKSKNEKGGPDYLENKFKTEDGFQVGYAKGHSMLHRTAKLRGVILRFGDKMKICEITKLCRKDSPSVGEFIC